MGWQRTQRLADSLHACAISMLSYEIQMVCLEQDTDAPSPSAAFQLMKMPVSSMTILQTDDGIEVPSAL